MWNPTGKPIEANALPPLVPDFVLYDYEGPRTFTCRDREGGLLLAHQCDEEGDLLRFIVVPFSPRLVSRLEQGELWVRDALDQPRSWIMDVDHRWRVVSAWEVSHEDIPEDVLPLPVGRRT